MDELDDNWTYNHDELTNRTPSRLDGISLEQEQAYREHASIFIMQLVKELLKTKPSSLCIVASSSSLFLQRFFIRKSFKDFDSKIVALACVFLAAKCEESLKKSGDCIQVYHRLLNPDSPPLAENSEVFVELKDSVFIHERIVLETICFDLQVKHSHAKLYPMIKVMHGCHRETGTSIGALCDTAWSVANDSLRTTLSLQYSDKLLAMAVIQYALKHHKWKLLPGEPWYEKVAREFKVTNFSLVALDDINRQLSELCFGKRNPDLAKYSEVPKPPPAPARLEIPPRSEFVSPASLSTSDTILARSNSLPTSSSVQPGKPGSHGSAQSGRSQQGTPSHPAAQLAPGQHTCPAIGAHWVEGMEYLFRGTGPEPYRLKRVENVYSCSCPVWRKTAQQMELCTCRHLGIVRGEQFEKARVGEKSVKRMMEVINTPVLAPNAPHNCPPVGAQWPEGIEFLFRSSGSEPYRLRRVGNVYSCTCSVWRRVSSAVEKCTCRHLAVARGDAQERSRVGEENMRRMIEVVNMGQRPPPPVTAASAGEKRKVPEGDYPAGFHESSKRPRDMI